MILYYFYPACSLAAHICLEESGLPFEARAVDLKDPAKEAELRKINPPGRVPALITADKHVLTENVAIMTYVADLAPNAKLLPSGTERRAQCMSFLLWGASTAHINFRMSIRPYRFSADPATHEGIVASGRKAFWENLQSIDARLTGQEWIMGSDFSAADAYALRFYDWGRITKQPVETLKAFTAHKDRMLERPAVRRVLAREGSPLVAAA
jgi:glutathione S-transferase